MECVVKGRWLSRWKGQEREGGKGEGVVKGRWDALLRGGAREGGKEGEGCGKREVGRVLLKGRERGGRVLLKWRGKGGREGRGS